MRRLAALFLLAACSPAAGPSAGPPSTGSSWTLASFDGVRFPARATLLFAGPEARGQGPCNAWSAPVYAGSDGMTGLGPVTATEVACPDLALEGPLFAALSQVSRIEQAGDALTLWAPGHILVFDRHGP
jgi:heat shock protein HslJ